MQELSPNSNLLPQEAKLRAQFIAMAPFVFQAALCLRDFEILSCLAEQESGLTLPELAKYISLSNYSLSVLLDAGLSAGLVQEVEGRFSITQVGRLIHSDPITKVNMDFSQDVCYQGLFNLKESLQTNTPVGLKVFGAWNTIYEGLSQLPAKAKKSWFQFDHFFSDDCLQRSLPLIFKNQPKRILDVGGNTGKFALACLKYDPEVMLTIADHPGQIGLAKANVDQNGFSLDGRISYFATNLLSEEALPIGHDVIWMSQLLSCFSAEQVVRLLRKARQALTPGGSLMIMETFTDTQKFSVARFCLDMTSLYFTAMANGNSRMYRLAQFKEFIRAAELDIAEDFPHVRLNHTILRCQPKGS